MVKNPNEMRVAVIYGSTSLTVDVKAIAESIAEGYETDDGPIEEYESDDNLGSAIHDYIGETAADQEWPSFQLPDREELIERVRAELVAMRASSGEE